mgnify:CR=1 FL=1
MKIFKDLDTILQQIPANKLEIASNLIDELSFLKETLSSLKTEVKNGGATATGGTGGGVTAANLDAYLLDIMSKYGSDPQSIFNYCRQFPYKYRPKQDVTSMACRMLNYKSGACWDYAALCYKMLRFC